MATIGLTLILSLGGVLQPVQEYGVGPRQVLHILLYFMPITLTFVLPMAALFASALAYGRFAYDNELNACRASGISLATLVYPGLVLAVFVAIANLLLSFHVMPYFVHLAEKSLKADAKLILFRNLQRRGYYSLPPDGRFLVYADYVDAKNDTLLGIVGVGASRGTVQEIVCADAAVVRIDPHDKFNEVHLDAIGAKHMTDADWIEVGSMSVSQEFGSLLGDNIKFKRVNEMKQIRTNLMQFDPVAKVALDAYRQLAREMLVRDINERLKTSQTSWYELRGSAGSVRFSAASASLEGEDIVLTPPVMIEAHDNRSGEDLPRLMCAEGKKPFIRLGEETTDPSLTLQLYNARVEATGQLVFSHAVSGLKLPEPIRQALARGSVLHVVAPEYTKSILRGPPSPTLAGLQETLAARIENTLVDIRAEMNTRLVFGIGCIPMIMIGIGLGIIQKGGHLLSAFGASCVPAATLIVAIISGKNVAESVGLESLSGILIMWGGLAGLTLLALLIYARLMRT
ncbi:MAG: LptF/LptG family permease [Sedimentisphaerales bacterium]|nr:LptF/LptG family permease [Sedimentisphaerales bacterium]